MGIWRARRRVRPRVRALLIAGTVAAVPSASMGLLGTMAAVAAPTAQAATAARDAPAAQCAALTGLNLPDLPGPDTATVSANEVAGSGCQVAIEITDTSDPRGGQPGMIGIDLTLPDTWNGSYMAEGNGVYCSPAAFVTLKTDQWLAAGVRDLAGRLRAHRVHQRARLAVGHEHEPAARAELEPDRSLRLPRAAPDRGCSSCSWPITTTTAPGRSTRSGTAARLVGARA